MNGNDKFFMKYFSSQQFNTLFMDAPIPPNTVITTLASDINESLENCIDYINDNGGFQIVLWYSRGEINDLSLVGLNAQEGAQVDAGRMNYHVVYVQPMRKKILDNSTTLGNELALQKFCEANHLLA